MRVDVFYLRRVGKKPGRQMRAVFSVRLNETPQVGLTLHGLYLMGDKKIGWWLGAPGRKHEAVFEPFVTFSSDLRKAVLQAALEKYERPK